MISPTNLKSLDSFVQDSPSHSLGAVTVDFALAALKNFLFVCF